ncbi:MAG: alpha-glucan family phosphorylase [Candidatus Eisenbacteria bacterium]|nr:alpha-glucan family phosphorylase [Candidatus Eisenbacteria bacterium]
MRVPQIRTAPVADIQIPVEFQGLYDLAYNLWWTWNRRAVRLFERIDPVRWSLDHNPVELLINVEPHRWDGLLMDAAFAAEYQAVVEEFESYMEQREDTWFSRRYPDYEKGPVAYFSTEFGWHECLSIYSGGLGILAGDHCKSASDLGIPFIGVGLMYKRGYFHQTIDADGHQQHHYEVFDFRRLPILPATTPSGRQVQVTVPLPGREVHLRIWKASVGRVPVLLLDSDVPQNHPADRPITSILYIRGREMRLCQEMLLGMGGVRALGTLGIEPGVWHLNEGHSALLVLERIDQELSKRGESGDDAFAASLGSIRNNTVFTTHTPVPAGNESFDLDLVERYLAERAAEWKLSEATLRNLGAPDSNGKDTATAAAPAEQKSVAAGTDGIAAPTPEEEGGNRDFPSPPPPPVPQFNLTAFAIRSSHFVNGVSELHGRVAQDLWQHVAGTPESERPDVSIGHVTNGVHAPTWIGPELNRLLGAHLGMGFAHNLDHPGFAEAVRNIPDQDLWTAHVEQKRRLIHEVRHRIREQFARHGRNPSVLRNVDSLLDEDTFTIGFARRFATYKRAALIFSQSDRLRDMLTNTDRPVQVLFAGKAHPADRPGQAIIQEIFQKSLGAEFAQRIVFLEDYDMRVGRHLVQGVDLWLNNPRRPLEASGTSGMKAALNGVLNFSVLDGWWCEGFDPSHGWALGEEKEYLDPVEQDREDAESLYRVLSEEIVPSYYDRDEAGVPHAWIGRMKEALAQLGPTFNTARMVREYVEKYYLPASK